MQLYYDIQYFLGTLFASGAFKTFMMVFFPFVFVIELPYYILTVLYSIRGWIRLHYRETIPPRYFPSVTVTICAYRESYEEILVSIQSVAEQIYEGRIECFIIVDNATENYQTSEFSRKIIERYSKLPNRSFKVIERLSRGGHASSMNLGLKLAKGEVLVMMDADTSIDNLAIAKSAAHFIDPNVIAISGAVRVRNIWDSLLCRVQNIEYMLGVQLARFGLTELNVTNNISGAFGVFRTSFVRQIGGWLNGTAEDLDLTFRMHVYMGHYPYLKIIHEPDAVAWTAVPTTWRALMKQRLRWDGDLYYIYIRRHWRKFSLSVMGKAKLLFFSWFGLYYQLALPFIVVLYTAILFLKYRLAMVLGIFFIVYLYYLLVSLFMFAVFLVLVSERPKKDSAMIGWVFLIPVYQQILRYMSTLFILNEVIFQGHKDTTMAPWWVIKRTK